jgi:hypothetical protein
MRRSLLRWQSERRLPVLRHRQSRLPSFSFNPRFLRVLASVYLQRRYGSGVRNFSDVPGKPIDNSANPLKSKQLALITALSVLLWNHSAACREAKPGRVKPGRGIIGTAQGQGVSMRGRLHTGAFATPYMQIYILSPCVAGQLVCPSTASLRRCYQTFVWVLSSDWPLPIAVCCAQKAKPGSPKPALTKEKRAGSLPLRA